MSQSSALEIMKSRFLPTSACNGLQSWLPIEANYGWSGIFSLVALFNFKPW